MNRAAISASGEPTATRAEAQRVYAALRNHVGKARAVKAADLALEAGVSGRATRAAYAEADGRLFVLGHVHDGIFIAETPEEAAGHTAMLRARAVDELARADLRDAWFAQQRTPLRQLTLEGVA